MMDAWYVFNSVYKVLQSFSIHSCEQWTFPIISHVSISKNHDVNINVKVLINCFESLGTFKFPLFVPCFYTPSLELVNPCIHDVFHIFSMFLFSILTIQIEPCLNFMFLDYLLVLMLLLWCFNYNWIMFRLLCFGGNSYLVVFHLQCFLVNVVMLFLFWWFF
jgi:hypothetical protein